jgi:hypothetical protein
VGSLTSHNPIGDSGVDIATGYGLDDQEVGVRDFSLLRIVQTISSEYRWLFPGAKRQEREADHFPSNTAEIKKAWIYTSTPPYVFIT